MAQSLGGWRGTRCGAGRECRVLFPSVDSSSAGRCACKFVIFRRESLRNVHFSLRSSWPFLGNRAWSSYGGRVAGRAGLREEEELARWFPGQGCGDAGADWVIPTAIPGSFLNEHPEHPLSGAGKNFGLRRKDSRLRALLHIPSHRKIALAVSRLAPEKNGALAIKVQTTVFREVCIDVSFLHCEQH